MKNLKALIAHSVITMLALFCIETPEIRAEINQWTSLPWPEGGAVQRVLIDPQNPNTLYATTLRGGIFKSTNGGENWRAINFGLANTAGSSLAIVRQDSSVLYAGLWTGGVFKSIDGGESWGTTGLTNISVDALAINPQNPRTVYAATATGLYKSTDGGITWARLSPTYLPPVQLLAIDPRRPDIIYAGEGGCCSNGALYRSPDGGVYWTDVPEMSGCLMTAVLFPLQQANTVFAAASCNVSETYLPSLFKSTDGGTSWSRTLNSGLPKTWSISTLAINPQNPDMLYAGTPDRGVFTTLDGGASWQTFDPALRPPSVNALVIDPQNASRIYIATGTGILKSTDAGTSWNVANTGLQANGVRAIGLDPSDSSSFYAAATDEWLFNKFTDGLQNAPGRLFKTIDRGTTWNAVNPAVNAVTTSLTVTRDRTVYACTNQAVFKSSDAGASWTPLPSFPAIDPLTGYFCLALAIDPQSPTTIYAATTGGLFKSTDGGRSWRAANSGLPTIFNRPKPVLTVAVDPTTTGTVYVATDSCYCDPPIPYGLFKSTDGATTWNRVNTLPTDKFIRSLVISPQLQATMYAATSDGFFKSTDGGSNWSSVNFGMDASSVLSLAVDPQDPATLYAGTAHGIFTITFEKQRPPAIDSFHFIQANVRIGDSYIARTSGANITAQTYFDILYREPGSDVVKEVWNWQTGAAGVHTVSPGTGLGTWIVIGVRAHEIETDHTGNFFPVSATITVSP